MSGKMRSFDRNLLRTSGRLANRVAETVPFCWFCNATAGTRSKEHIFPQWLLRHYGVSREIVHPTRINMSGQILSERGARPLISHTNGEVCSNCNNGWMSELDASVIPVLTRTPRRGRLTPDEAETLARWFIKVAVNLNVTQPYRLLVSASTRHHLAVGIPDNLAVDLFRVREQDGVVDWIQGAMAGFVIREHLQTTISDSLVERTLVTHVRVADLVAVVVALPSPLKAQYLVPSDDTARIWPLPDTLPTWGGIHRHDHYMSVWSNLDYDGPAPFISAPLDA